MLPAYITFNVCNNSAQIALYSERALGRLGSGLAESRLARAALVETRPNPDHGRNTRLLPDPVQTSIVFADLDH